MEYSRKLAGAIAYFKSEHGFDRLLRLFKLKYESLGRVGGSVKVDTFSEAQLEAIAAFTGQTFYNLKLKPFVSLSHFEQQLQKTKFEGLSLQALLEGYFGESLISKKEASQKKQADQDRFFKVICKRHPWLSWWVNHIQKKLPDSRFVFQIYERDPSLLNQRIRYLAAAIHSLPAEGEAVRLPFFAQKLTGNPHAFDLTSEQGRLLLHALSVRTMLVNDETGIVQTPSSSEEMSELLLSYGIYRDDITNYVTCANIIAYTGDGSHPVWAAAAASQTVMNIPIRELNGIQKAMPSQGNDVWIVENSGVCSAILDVLPSAPILCTHGQFKLAAFLLLDKLTKKTGVQLHYSGDLDPEGLGMADRLQRRYPEHVKLWRMSPADYAASLSSERLNPERLAKLNSVSGTDFAPVIESMQRKQCAAYQEALIDLMIEDIRAALYN